ncbi:hypothetical protein GCK72_022006 [Caenorhabditis remanei]|uniref:DUF19 domain-containing protein n=1 Tax=Caenorhabditis remanei TaxID=31234 RepID=A0A6A5GJH5_CAERE|nr:hypothetical protein GCK72_022006 [Caenorhabditis remanei]KAF1755437.1 hypothetical protein GCK72_022006 [Caenorhabditis remanei]
MRALFLTVALIVLHTVNCADNRLAMATKCVNTLGITFYTAAQLNTIFACADPQVYATPTNTTAMISVAKDCIINNSGSKALAALSLYTNINSCLSPDDILTLATEWATPLTKLTKTLTNKCLKKIKTCKAAGTAQEACLQKLYTLAKAAITKAYVDKICKKFVKQNLSKSQYACGVKYAPQVMTITGYKCATLTIT